jgi:general secretion pathway protein A
MDYESFFNFDQEPFSNVPDPRFFFSGPEHAKPFLRIMYSAQRMKGLVILIGNAGTGKTTLSRKVLASLLNEKEYLPGMLVLTKDEYPKYWLTSKIAELLKVRDGGNLENRISEISRKLFELKREGRRPVVIIDEANKLKSDENLEELRSILNIEDEEQKLITFILCGMPVLKELIDRNESLRQRIAYFISLHPMSEGSTFEYIKHRLRIAGAHDEIFSEDAFGAIYKWSRGRPRLVNSICDNTLLEAVLLQKKPITGEMVNLAAESLGLMSEVETE